MKLGIIGAIVGILGAAAYPVALGLKKMNEKAEREAAHMMPSGLAAEIFEDAAKRFHKEYPNESTDSEHYHRIVREEFDKYHERVDQRLAEKYQRKK